MPGGKRDSASRAATSDDKNFFMAPPWVLGKYALDAPAFLVLIIRAVRWLEKWESKNLKFTFL
jgi:hypothetical protein